MTPSVHITRLKRAELLSSLGAGVLGAGVALLLANLLTTYAIPILLLGLISHALGMFQKHGLEQKGEAIRVWWVEILYWLCWLALIVLLLLIFIRQF
jgi:hypothetical protein